MRLPSRAAPLRRASRVPKSQKQIRSIQNRKLRNERGARWAPFSFHDLPGKCAELFKRDFFRPGRGLDAGGQQLRFHIRTQSLQ